MCLVSRTGTPNEPYVNAAMIAAIQPHPSLQTKDGSDREMAENADKTSGHNDHHNNDHEEGEDDDPTAAMGAVVAVVIVDVVIAVFVIPCIDDDDDNNNNLVVSVVILDISSSCVFGQPNFKATRPKCFQSK